MVRNSVGSGELSILLDMHTMSISSLLMCVLYLTDCYVSDEVITSRAGVRVRVVNTDAEGRMVMADLLYKAKKISNG